MACGVEACGGVLLTRWQMGDGEAGRVGEEGSGGARAEEIEGRRRALLGGGGGFSATCDSFPSFLFFPLLSLFGICALCCGLRVELCRGLER